MAHYCCSFVCGAEADCAIECAGCPFMYDCYYCVNENCDQHGKHEDEFERSDDLCDEGADEDE